MAKKRKKIKKRKVRRIDDLRKIAKENEEYGKEQEQYGGKAEPNY